MIFRGDKSNYLKRNFVTLGTKLNFIITVESVGLCIEPRYNERGLQIGKWVNFWMISVVKTLHLGEYKQLIQAQVVNTRIQNKFFRILQCHLDFEKDLLSYY